MKYYTWKDIERKFGMSKETYENLLSKIEVYPDSVIIYKRETTKVQDVKNLLQDLFPLNFRENLEDLDSDGSLSLDVELAPIPIYVEDGEEPPDSSVTPIFRNILYRKSSYPVDELQSLNCPVIAFHSYKGGVGRTLSLLAFARAWSELFPSGKNKLLIVDADVEAPGLTWLNQENMVEDCFSYLDLLDLLQDSSDIDMVVNLVKDRLSSIKIMTDEQFVNQIFLPIYRYKEQLFDMYATPDTIVNSKGKKYALADTLSRLGESVGASAVIVDLRAGLSDYSATLLFDPRVKKYLVTSTSEQSVKGTELLLDLLSRGLKISQDTILPEILLNMVIDSLNNSPELKQIVERLKKNYEKDDPDEDDKFVDNYLTQIPFASELIHLSTMDQIFHMMTDRMLLTKMKDLIKARYIESTGLSIDTKKRKKVLENIHQLASAQLVSENASEFKILTTKSIQFLLQKYKTTIPQTVITGAKGSGKTFLYSQMIQEKSWGAFCQKAQPDIGRDYEKAYFLPALATQASENLQNFMKDCVNNCKKNIPSVDADGTVYGDNAEILLRYKDYHDKAKESEWIDFWEGFLAKTVNPKFTTIKEANDSLKKDEKKVILLIDGLEEIFKNVGEKEGEKNAISSLCQRILNRFTSKYSHIGIVVFLRYDMAQDAISVNFDQFMSAYDKYSLRWTQEEALRLALWLVKQAYPEFIKDSVDIVSASRDVIDQNLIRLWGRKLGKVSSNEAYTSRWILAALSDFNGQLQARDIIRFLKHATQNSGQNKTASYDDRYIMPQNVREAVIQCSKEKIDEIEQEYHTLKPIFEKMRKYEPKILPLTDASKLLTMKEQQNLKSAGFWKKIDDKYYLPEIIRHALGYRYIRGARPKVLSLLLRK